MAHVTWLALHVACRARCDHPRDRRLEGLHPMVGHSNRRETLLVAAAALAAGVFSRLRTAQAQSVPATEGATVAATGTARATTTDAPTAAFDQLAKPADGVIMPPGYAQVVAHFAYIWGWPLINMANRRAAITKEPHPGHASPATARQRSAPAPAPPLVQQLNNGNWLPQQEAEALRDEIR